MPEYNKALALEPQNFRALYGKGRLARVMRRPDESLRYYQALLERDPVNAFVMAGLVTTLTAVGRTSDAERAARKMLEINPNILEGHWYLAYALLWNGESDAALSEIQLEPLESLRFSGLAIIQQARRDQNAADAALHELLASNDSRKAYFVAAVYAARGESARAIEWLKHVHDEPSGVFGEVTTDPAFNAIRKDVAFLAYLRQVKLPE